jgi:hypothetical protein
MTTGEDQMTREVKFSELWQTIERAGRSHADFHIAVSHREPGWIVVKSRTTTRNYPMGWETAILLSAELRHGIFDRGIEPRTPLAPLGQDSNESPGV